MQTIKRTTFAVAGIAAAAMLSLTACGGSSHHGTQLLGPGLHADGIQHGTVAVRQLGRSHGSGREPRRPRLRRLRRSRSPTAPARSPAWPRTRSPSRRPTTRSSPR